MINKLARKGTQIIRENVCHMSYDEEVYIYGIEIILSTMINIFTILCISTMMSEISMGIVYMLFFIPLRIYAGGYHAHTYGTCFIVSNVSYIIELLIVELLWKNVSNGILWIVLIFVCFYIISKAPIINKNQLINKNQQIRNSKTTKYIIFIDIILIFFFTVTNKKMMTMAICSICSIAIFMLLAEISNIRKGYKIWKLL